MKKIIDLLFLPYDSRRPNDVSRIIVIDVLTIGLGFVMIIHGLTDFNHHTDGSDIGAALFILGVLIRVWRKTF